MSFASDKLFNGYIRTKMPMIATQVKVREIVPHLPCLTPSDREEIEAKREISGNFTAMQHLLDCLRRRENWPEQFITALETCEHLTMAGEIGAEYHSLKTPSAPKPPCPTSTVVMATVHSTPSVSPSAPAVCEGVPTGSSLAETTEAPGDPQSPVSFSEPGARTSLPDPQNPSTPPPSPEIAHLSPRAEVPAHQEPEENSEESEEFVVDVGGPGPADAVGAACDVAAETGSPTQPESMETWRSSELRSSSEDLGSAPVTMTPVKLPVQDSDPPGLSKPTLVRNSGQPVAVPLVDGVDRLDILEPDPARCCEEEEENEEVEEDEEEEEDEEDEGEVCLSKPMELLSVQPNTAQHATLPTTALLQPPFSGNISLQISDPEPLSSGSDLQGSKGSPSQENHYVSDDLASFAEREAQEVLEHVGHVMQEPSIQNLASPSQGILGNAVCASQDQRWDEGQSEIVVQSPSSSSPPPPPPPPPGGDGGDEGRLPLQELHPQILNGKATPPLAQEQVPARQQPVAVQPPQEPKKEVSVVNWSPRTKYIVTAAGIAACGMFAAWRLKN